MSGIHLILVGLGAFGFLPLFIILYKKNRAKRILKTGVSVKARVYHVRTSRQPPADTVYYTFYAQNTTQQYTGTLMIESGTYKPGDVFDIYYEAGNPKRNTVQGAWGSPGLVIFGIVIAAFILFAAYKMYEMVEAGSM